MKKTKITAADLKVGDTVWLPNGQENKVYSLTIHIVGSIITNNRVRVNFLLPGGNATGNHDVLKTVTNVNNTYFFNKEDIIEFKKNLINTRIKDKAKQILQLEEEIKTLNAELNG